MDDRIIVDKILERQLRNLKKALETGKDKKGLTFRLVELTEKTRTRGGVRSRRRTARVWRPVEPEQPSAD